MTAKFFSDALLDSHKDMISHGFFGRVGGVSSGIYDSLNCGLGSNDNKSNVETNRKLILESLALDHCGKINTLYQIHSSDAVIIDKNIEAEIKGDALVTNVPNVVIAVGTADCTPILFLDPIKRVIGAAHAGWGGAFKGVVEDTIKKMQILGAESNNIIAAIGPLIGYDSYEVGAEFYDNFRNKDESFVEFFKPALKESHYFFDLRSFVIRKLQNSGVTKISNVNIDTYKSEDTLFSYRRSCHKNEQDYGRQLSVICLV